MAALRLCAERREEIFRARRWRPDARDAGRRHRRQLSRRGGGHRKHGPRSAARRRAGRDPAPHRTGTARAAAAPLLGALPQDQDRGLQDAVLPGSETLEGGDPLRRPAIRRLRNPQGHASPIRLERRRRSARRTARPAARDHASAGAGDRAPGGNDPRGMGRSRRRDPTTRRKAQPRAPRSPMGGATIPSTNSDASSPVRDSRRPKSRWRSWR